MSKKYKIGIVYSEKVEIYKVQERFPSTVLRGCNDALLAGLLRMMHEDRFTYEYAKIYADNLERIRKEGHLVQTIDPKELGDNVHKYPLDYILFDIDFATLSREGIKFKPFSSSHSLNY
jgi:hypothetical protein